MYLRIDFFKPTGDVGLLTPIVVMAWSLQLQEMSMFAQFALSAASIAPWHGTMNGPRRVSIHSPITATVDVPY